MEMKEFMNYETPQVEVIEVKVEKGFNYSPPGGQPGGTGDNWGGLN